MYKTKEGWNAYMRKYAAAHKGTMAAHERKYRKAHPEKRITCRRNRRAREASSGGKFAAAEWKALLEKYKYTCLCCGRDDVKLEADHVIPLYKGGTNDISNRQPLCHSCNSKKHTKCTDYRPSGL